MGYEIFNILKLFLIFQLLYFAQGYEYVFLSRLILHMQMPTTIGYGTLAPMPCQTLWNISLKDQLSTSMLTSMALVQEA